jgi:general secretion pathway protein D
MGFMALAGCANWNMQPEIAVRNNSLGDRVDRADRPAGQGDSIGDAPANDNQLLKQPFNERLRATAVPSIKSDAPQTSDEVKAPALPETAVDASVPPLILPAFIDVVFGEILKVPYSTGPEVAARKDVIQLRSSGALSAPDFLHLVSVALKDYGIRVSPQDGLYVVIADANARGRRPQFLRSRSRQSTPAALRPVVQFVQMQAIDSNNMRNLLLQAFPRGGALEVTNDTTTGSVILTGLPEDVDAALEIIETMDDLAFANSEVMQFKPIFWQVEELAEQLAKILRAEGWQASVGERQFLPIHMVPVPFSNSLLVFVREEEARQRVLYWLNSLDQPSQKGDIDQIFVYDVQNTDAASIAETANAVLSNRGGRLPGAETTTAPTAANASNGGSQSRSQGEIVVDPLGNRLIFSGSASDYQRLLQLLRRLDQPTPEVLIEVTVAEVTLTDETQYGVEFFVNSVGGSGADVSFGTDGGLGLSASGFNLGFLSGDVSGALNAFAQNQQVNVLSTPRLVARSGGAANIQVGTDVPVITSQSAADQQSGGGSRDVLQSVQFRSTGVLLNIEPIVYSTGRVDLTITQEVSSALPNPNAAIASPIISNRNLSTQLTLDDGGTAVLGGLIQDSITRGDTGIPLLKDIPWLGSLFSVDSLSVERTELLVIITAYIIRSSEDRARFVDYLTDDINRSLADPLKLRTRLPKQP